MNLLKEKAGLFVTVKGHFNSFPLKVCVSLWRKKLKNNMPWQRLSWLFVFYVFCFIAKRLICSIKDTLCTEYSSLLEFITRHVLIYLLEWLITQRANFTIYVAEKYINGLERIIVVVTKKNHPCSSKNGLIELSWK